MAFFVMMMRAVAFTVLLCFVVAEESNDVSFVAREDDQEADDSFSRAIVVARARHPSYDPIRNVRQHVTLITRFLRGRTSDLGVSRMEQYDRISLFSPCLEL